MKKLIVNVTELASAMRFNRRRVNRKSAQPKSEDLKFDVTPSKLTITSAAIENLISTVPCEADDNFSFLLSAGDVQLIENLDEGSLAITVNKESGNVTLINHIAFNSFNQIVKANLFA